MFQALFRTRRRALTILIIAAAFLICGIAWLRFFTVIAASPSPVRFVEFVTADGERAPFRQECAGPSFVEADSVWRFCAYDEAAPGTETPWGLVRFNLDEGRAEMLWPLPESATSQVLALAESPAGDLVVAWGAPDLSAVYLILRAGGVVPLGLPDNAPTQLFGLAWAGETLEMAALGVDETVAIFTNESGIWTGTRRVGLPASCAAEGMLCALQMAHRTPERWRFVLAQAPVEVNDPTTARVQILLFDETGAVEPVDEIALSDLDPLQYTLEDGRLVALGALFDRSPGNVVNWSLRAAPFVLHGGTWERVVAPQIDASFYYSDYEIEEGGLRWIPGLRFPLRGWQVEEWVTLRSSAEGIFLTDLQGQRKGPTLTRSTVLAEESAAATSVLPASDGGYWVLGPYGAYVKADRSLSRADDLTPPERVLRFFENFGRLENVSPAFYQTQRALKLAALPLVLLSLPTGYLGVFFLRQSRKDRQTWIVALVEVSAVYLILVTLFIWWFWELMNHF